MDKHPASQFTIAALASCAAATFTNPCDVIKVRMQLQGELQRAGNYQVKYEGVVHAFKVIAREEGVGALQKGLRAAYLQQVARNGVRLGSYDYVKATLTQKGQHSNVANVVAGAAVGALGALSASPFLLVKIRMQAASCDSSQGGVTRALYAIYREKGVRGWYHGAWPSIVRSMVGSAAQLSWYDATTHSLCSYGFRKDASSTHLVSGFVASFFVTIVMNPFDIVMTRNYNTSDVKKYSGVADTMIKIAKTEGARGFLKGFWPHYLRMGPHTVLTFFFWERLKLEAGR